MLGTAQSTSRLDEGEVASLKRWTETARSIAAKKKSINKHGIA